MSRGRDGEKWYMGIDAGASLIKVALRGPDGQTSFSLLASDAKKKVLEQVKRVGPAKLGFTGCGAQGLMKQLDRQLEAARPEFEAWARGSNLLLQQQQIAPSQPYLLASIGTGTSVLRVEGDRVSRVGGTALGGGAMLGLASALTGCQSHAEFCQLADAGDRQKVDLLVRDIYPAGESELGGELTAAAFGKVAERSADSSEERKRRFASADLAAAVSQLIGENLALICCGLCASTQIDEIVYGGGTLIDNPTVTHLILGITAAMGHRPILLGNGGFAGALGALELASEP